MKYPLQFIRRKANVIWNAIFGIILACSGTVKAQSNVSASSTTDGIGLFSYALILNNSSPHTNNLFLAYKYVATAAMIAEINYCAGKLHLPVDQSNTQREFRSEEVAPPNIMAFGGRFDTDHYSFCFGETGRLRFITKLHPFGNVTIHQRNQMLLDSGLNSLISTNGAYELATNWLNAISVDVSSLEITNAVHIRQQMATLTDDTKVLLPLFNIAWGDVFDPQVTIEIDGRNKELLSLRLEYDSFSNRPISLIKNRDELMAIPDSVFLKYSPLEKSNLVVRFSESSH
jgi:hypothetical protein